jgi:hypothetical protein
MAAEVTAQTDRENPKVTIRNNNTRLEGWKHGAVR